MGAYHLQTVVPAAERIRRLPLTRDQLMLLIAAVSELFTGIDVYLAHNVNAALSPNEWVPVIFGVGAGVILLLAGLLAFRNRPLATVLANLIFIASILIGLIGSYFHLDRAGFVGDVARGREVNALIWAPPFLGPFFFILIAILGISAAWVETPADSGRLRLLANRYIQMPYSKTRAYFLLTGIFALVTTISSVMDHARLNFESVGVWLPIVAGVFATVTALCLGFFSRPTRMDLTVYTVSMIMLIVIGLVGAILHANTKLIPQGIIVVERFIRGSPLLAPLLFANVGLIGLITLLDPAESDQA